MNSGNKESAVTVAQYDDKLKRKSQDDPLRHHRRSSIPFVDRKPAVRFIRAIDLRKASVAGPNTPVLDDNSKKPILKKSQFPILVSGENDNEGQGSIASTNDELDECRIKTDLIMDRISRAERIARGSMDVLTFPTSTRRVEALSRYQGSLTISVCTIDILTTSSEYSEEKKKKNDQIVMDVQAIVDLAQQMLNQANVFQNTAKKFLSRAKSRYNEWESFLKRNVNFRIDHSKLNYPIYTHKRMPESVTLYEDGMEDPQSHTFDGYVRICRKYPEEIITLHCDSSDQADQYESINFHESPLETQTEVIKFVTGHGKDLLVYSENCLNQGLEFLFDQELDDAFNVIQKKISSLEYDECFDPLCALELKNSLGELVARKAELLNTAEQIFQHCKQITTVAKMFYRYTKRSVAGGGAGCACCIGGSSKKKLLNLLGLVSIDDISILLPLTLAVAQDIFHMDAFNTNYSSDNINVSSTE